MTPALRALVLQLCNRVDAAAACWHDLAPNEVTRATIDRAKAGADAVRVAMEHDDADAVTDGAE
jgi:hypothetical protein